jgi:hypothetical protein
MFLAEVTDQREKAALGAGPPAFPPVLLVTRLRRDGLTRNPVTPLFSAAS